ncbi:MAG: hypothetical protein Q4F05_06655 [bacterium]|nr:hypothetical protein [bacterium]
MIEVYSQEQGFLYSPMSGAGNRLLMTEFLSDGCELQEYDTETKIMNSLKKFYFDNDTNTGEVIRNISSDDKRYWVMNASRDHNENYLFSMFYKDPVTGEVLAPRLYI